MAEAPFSTAAFTDQAARCKTALSANFAFALAMYPFVMAATTAARTAWMALVNPRPHGCSPASASDPPPRPGPDLWATDDGISIASTVIAFSLVLVAHGNLLTHLTLKRITGAPRIAKKYSGTSAVTMVLCTALHYLNYIKSSRYGVSQAEWTIFSVFTSFMVAMTVYFTWVPLKQNNVVKLGQLPP